MIQNKSNQRTVDVTLEPNIVNTIDFFDTTPNYVYIKNFDAAELFLAMDSIPNEAKFDRKITPFGEGIYGQVLGVKKIRIYNKSTRKATIRLVSFEGIFDPTVLLGQMQIDDPAAEEKKFDGVIRGFQSALPSGGNHIGRVTIDELPSLRIEDMPSIEVELPSIHVDISSNYVNHYSSNIIVDTSIHSINFPNEIETFDFIMNDGVSDLFINFDMFDTLPVHDGLNGWIHLRSNEGLNHFNRKANSIHFIRETGVGNVRFVGVMK